MKCERIENLLSSYSEGTLGPKEKQLVEAHLAECRDCVRLLGLLQDTEAALTGFPELRISQGLLRKLYALPAQKKTAAPKYGFFVRLVRQPVFVPAAALVVAAVIFVTSPDRDAILRTLNRQAHIGYSKVERVYAQAGSLLDELNSYREDALVSLKRINPLSKNGDK